MVPSDPILALVKNRYAQEHQLVERFRSQYIILLGRCALRLRRCRCCGSRGGLRRRWRYNRGQENKTQNCRPVAIFHRTLLAELKRLRNRQAEPRTSIAIT